MTYLNFLLIFIVPLVIIGFVYYQKSTYPDKNNLKQAVLFLIVLAVVYTTPWDNYLVKTGVWNYEDHNILFKIGYVPIEEYLFFILQTLLTSFWSLFVLKRHQLIKSTKTTLTKHFISLFLITTFILSIFMLGQNQSRYMGLILVWATPVFILQWLIGGQHLIKNGTAFLACLIPPTLYLWCVDSFALHKQTWAISSTQTLGFKIGNLPVEEAVFFLATNIMLCQGLILYLLLKNDFIKLKKKVT